MNFVQIAELIGCHGNIKGKFSKKYLLLRNCKGVEAERLLTCS